MPFQADVFIFLSYRTSWYNMTGFMTLGKHPRKHPYAHALSKSTIFPVAIVLNL